MMKLDITKGIQRKGIDVPFEIEDAWGEDHWNGDTISYVRPVSFSGTYMLADETVIVRGVARAVIESPCARCLAPTETSVEAEVSEAFIRDIGQEREADDDQYMYSGHVLELDEAVRTSLLLELPTRILCKEDCRGYCSQCGANLNINECSCQKDLTHRNPFSALASLLNEDEEV
ncbi:MAG: DUF177 domain-containing protein [Clostridia bacterium]|nr:DUF177 domain-containing protein [Clostridia bacterium]MBQ7052344.1 DUF177 domain-containing protein [Clostridia bacterium]